MFFETLAVAALAVCSFAQESSITLPVTTPRTSAAAFYTTRTSLGAETTISAFVGTGLAGSIVSADACETVLAVQCTDDSNYYCAEASRYGATEVTLTQEASAVALAYSTSTEGASVNLAISCDLQGTSPTWTGEVCSLSIYASGPGLSTSISTTTSIATQLSAEALPITAGAEKLPSSGATCTATTTNAAAPTAMAQVYKVLVPVGAAVAGAAAFL